MFKVPLSADPAAGTATLLDEALASAASTANLTTGQAPPLDTSFSGYTIGQRIPSSTLVDGALTPAGPFAIPIDPFSGYCVDGGRPVGMGLSVPQPASVR